MARSRAYSRDKFRTDFVAGINVALLSFPQAIGFAIIAGLPVQAVNRDDDHRGGALRVLQLLAPPDLRPTNTISIFSPAPCSLCRPCRSRRSTTPVTSPSSATTNAATTLRFPSCTLKAICSSAPLISGGGAEDFGGSADSRCILHLKNARHLDASTVLALLQLHALLQTTGRHLLLSGVNSDVHRVFANS